VKFRLFIFALLIYTSGAICLDNVSAQYQQILKFSAYLQSIGEYERAASELEKYSFYIHEKSDSINFAIGRNYLLAGQYEKAQRLFQEIAKTTSSPYCAQSKSYSAYINFKKQQYLQSVNQLHSADSCLQKEEPNGKNELLACANYILMQKWDNAEPFLRHDFDFRELNVTRENLFSLFNAGHKISKKSPTKAAFFSAIIPGSGKIYAGRAIDGIFAFLLISGTSYMAYDGFRSDRPVKAGVFTGLTGIFYIGNIYGSHINAHIYNTANFSKIEAGVNLEIDNLFLDH